jgi:mRNA interferase MazF
MIRGEIWWADFGIPFGREPGFERPVLIVQGDDFNRSNIHTIVVVPLTTNLRLEEAPGNVLIEKEESTLSKDSVAVVSQIYAIDKRRMLEKVRRIDARVLDQVEQGLLLVLGIRKIGRAFGVQ